MNAHKEGPWALSYDAGSTRDVIAADGTPICTIRQAWVTREQYRANAHLVVASPALLKACKRLAFVLQNGGDETEFDEAIRLHDEAMAIVNGECEKLGEPRPVQGVGP